MRRNRNVFIAAAVAAALLIVFLATRSSGSDASGVRTTKAKNCPPVARMDAAATTPDAPVAVDVLANDTDADGDPLVFQIVKTTGGTSTVDDGATPTDASDDRVLFTPAVPAPPAAVVEYQAIDPGGAAGTSTVEISINDLGTLPDGMQSATVSTDDTSGTEDCDASTTDTTLTPDTTTEVTPTTDLLLDEEVSGPPTTRSGAKSTSKSSSSKKSSSKTTTTTSKKSTTSTTAGHSGTTEPTSPPTTKPPTTTTGPTTSTTSPFDRCGPPPPGNPPSPEWTEWGECMNS